MLRPVLLPILEPVLHFGLTSRRSGGGAAWSPAALFANGEQGAWYDPSDLSTMFQDAAGIIPVTGPNQPVRLILDKRLWGGKTLAQFLADQPELVVDSDFDDAGAWATTPAGAWVVAGGKASSDTNQEANGRYLYQLADGKFAASESYHVTMDKESGSVVGVGAYYGGAFRGNVVIPTVSSTCTGIFHVTDTIPAPNRLSLVLNNIQQAVVTRLSIKHIPGNHATAPNDASRPILRNSGALWWLEFDGFDDWLDCGDVLDPLTDSIESVAGVSLVSSQFAVWAKSYYSGQPGRIAMASVYGDNNAAAAAFYAPISSPIIGGPTPTSVAGTTKVYSSSVDRTAGTVTLRADGSVSGGVGSFTPDAATSQNTTAVMMIGAHNSSGGTDPSQFHNGNIYGLILRLTPTIMADKARQAAESWMAVKSGVTL